MKKIYLFYTSTDVFIYIHQDVRRKRCFKNNHRLLMNPDNFNHELYFIKYKQILFFLIKIKQKYTIKLINL